ncbi:hypothetical protein CBS101457_005715 [Exobasidium rhododendri]|nr:hypothetical protein CBS101457_005715 [Exobasidium rhododendri]
MSSKLTHTLPPNPVTSRGTFTSIATDPTGKKLVYCQSRSVVIRPLSTSEPTIVYAQHAHPTTVAKISPSGYYCASADISGNVRVWDLAGTDQILKLEIKALGGRITDLVWDGESKRIGVVGEGKDKFGHFFLLDSGSSCGEVTGHSKVTNAIAMKVTRPYRAVTAGDDGNIVFYNGVPFKYAKSFSTHKGFVQSVAYAPSGSSFVSVGSDGKIFLYDGSTGEMQSTLTDEGDTAHKGTIFSCAFSSDSTQILSCGADGFLKVWEASGSLLKSFDLNGKNAVTTNNKSDDQLVGCTFAEGKEKAVAVSLAGEINVVDIKSGEISKLLGATKAISTASLVRSAEGNLVAGSYDGRVLSYDESGVCTPLGSSSAAVTGLAVSQGLKAVWIIGLDDTLRRASNGKFDTIALATTGQPKSVASSGSDHVLVATTAGVDIVIGNPPVKSHRPSNDLITAVACSEDGKHFALGREDSKVILCTLDASSGQLKDEATFDSGRSAITALAFSKDGKYLASGESNGKINVHDVEEKKIKFNQWVFHTARINAIEFSPDGTQAVSASLDTNVYVWSTLRPMKSIAIKNAFPGGAHGACWLDSNRIASAGADGTAKIHTITPVPSA